MRGVRKGQIWKNLPYTADDGENLFKINYAFTDLSLSPASQYKIEQNIKKLEEETCLRWHKLEKTEEKTLLQIIEEKYDEGIMRFMARGGCYSVVGRHAENPISIGQGCERDGTIQHRVRNPWRA